MMALEKTMMKKQKDNLYIQIHESWYNKTKVSDDGITHITDTSKQYPLYQLEIQKCYFVDTRDEAVKEIIQDLKGLVTDLEKLVNKEREGEGR